MKFEKKIPGFKKAWSLLGLLVVLSLLVSCNHGGKNETTGKDTSTTSPASKTNGMTSVNAPFNGNFPVLYIATNTICNAFGNAQVKKIVLQFNFDGGAANGQPSLNGYAAKNNGTFGPPMPAAPQMTFLKSSANVPIPYPFYLNNLEFTRTAFSQIVPNPANPPHPFLVFTPMISLTATNVVTYRTSWSDVQPTTVPKHADLIGDELNPSPPKDPFN